MVVESGSEIVGLVSQRCARRREGGSNYWAGSSEIFDFFRALRRARRRLSKFWGWSLSIERCYRLNVPVGYHKGYFSSFSRVRRLKTRPVQCGAGLGTGR